MSKHASPTLVGTFMIVALALAATSIIILGGGRFFHKTTRFVVYFDEAVSGLHVGAPVKLRGIDIGEVKDIRINLAGAVGDPTHIRIPVICEVDLDRLSAEGVTEIDLRDRAQVKRLVDAGLRASLETESLVTGVRYVALDIRPNTPANMVGGPEEEYAEIPTVPSPLAKLPDKADIILAGLAQIDYPAIGRSVKATVEEVHTLVASPSIKRTIAAIERLTQQADRTVADFGRAVRGLAPALADIRDAAKSTSRIVAPDGRFANRLDQALGELTAAARALRRVAEHVDRDPGSLLRGGQQ